MSSGIEQLMARTCNQTAVYWGNPVNDGYGKNIFDDPVEIDCRWEEMLQVVIDDKGNEITSRAVVYLTQDVDYEGILYLGTLEDLYETVLESSLGGLDDPMAIENIFIIKRFEKKPVLGSTSVFLRKAYLTPSLSFGGF